MRSIMMPRVWSLKLKNKVRFWCQDLMQLMNEETTLVDKSFLRLAAEPVSSPVTRRLCTAPSLTSTEAAT